MFRLVKRSPHLGHFQSGLLFPDATGMTTEISRGVSCARSWAKDQQQESGKKQQVNAALQYACSTAAKCNHAHRQSK
jgi:hypothetical protein